MSIVYGLKLMADLCLYLAELSILSLLGAVSPMMLGVAALLSLGSAVGYILGRKGQKRRILPLIPACILTALVPNTGELILCLPMIVYSVFYVVKNPTATDYYYAFQRFRVSLIVLAFSVIVGLLLAAENVAGAVPAIFLHLTLMIALLRMLRHDDRIIRQRRFQMVNLAGIAGVCLAGWILSTETALRIIRTVIGFLYEEVILRIVNVILWCVGMLLQGLFYLISLIPLKGGGEIDLAQLNQWSSDELLEGLSREEVASNPALEMAFKIAGGVVGCILILLILKALAGHTGRLEHTSQKEERETLDDAEQPLRKPGLLARRRDPALSVRYTYQRFLRQAAGHGVPLNGRQNSRQVQTLSKNEFNEAAMSDLRETYIRVRYGEKNAPEDVKQAKDAYGRLNKTA